MVIEDNMKKLLLFLSLITLISCKKSVNVAPNSAIYGLEKIIIKKDQNYSWQAPRYYSGGDRIRIRASFTESCEYNLGTIDQLDINKLAGVSFGKHQDNSIRIGWNWSIPYANISLFLFMHEDGKMKSYFLSNYDINKLLDAELLFDRANDIVTVNYEGVSLSESYKFPNIKCGYYLNPYFGGNRKATKNTTIYLKID